MKPEAAKAVAPAAVAGEAKIAVEGFETPESVLYDAEADLYLVSNIVGSPLDKDDLAYISKVSPEGKVLEAKWIDSASADLTLHAPKGLALSGGLLYVSDIDRVRMFDAKTGAAKGEIVIEGATFLNDVAVGPDKVIYVSDTGMKKGAAGLEPSGTDAVYAIDEAGKAKKVASGSELEGPNGLLVDGSTVWVASFRGRKLHAIEDGKITRSIDVGHGGLDGLVGGSDGTVYVTSWDAKAVLAGRTDGGSFHVVVPDVATPADLGFDTKRKRLLVPSFEGNKVESLPEPSARLAAATPTASAVKPTDPGAPGSQGAPAGTAPKGASEGKPGAGEPAKGAPSEKAP